MKVLVAIIFTIGTAAAGSGPYLPRGWKPEGPAFYLPSEVQKPSENPLKDTLFEESEASGSENLREYGPPELDEAPLQVTNQGLPDVITTQSFFAADMKSEPVSAAVVIEEAADIEVNTEQVIAVETTTTVEGSQDIITEVKTTQFEEQPTSESLFEIEPTIQGSIIALQPNVEAKILELELVSESVDQTSEAFEETTEKVEVVQVIPDELVVIPDLVIQEVIEENLGAGANNIAETLENLEKESKVAEIQAVEAVTEIKGTLETTGSLEQAPEGFLEYGPPGFREYGPPNEEDLVRSAIDQIVSADPLENNEVRRRRFSPKFRPSRINKKTH